MLSYYAFCQMKREADTRFLCHSKYFQNFFPGKDFDFQKFCSHCEDQKLLFDSTWNRDTQREYSSKLLKHSIVKSFLVLTVDIGIFLALKNFSSVKNVPLKMGNYTIFQMFENPRTGRQAKNFATNVQKILDPKSSSEQIFSENWRCVSLIKPVLVFHSNAHAIKFHSAMLLSHSVT